MRKFLKSPFDMQSLLKVLDVCTTRCRSDMHKICDCSKACGPFKPRPINHLSQTVEKLELPQLVLESWKKLILLQQRSLGNKKFFSKLWVILMTTCHHGDLCCIVFKKQHSLL